MEGFEIIRATVEDEQTLCEMFLKHITAHPEYISHGEIQMGVGEGRIEEGILVAAPARLARAKWMKYIDAHIADKDTSNVWKALGQDGGLAGFCVADIQEDGDEPFGMVCDVLVKEEYRGAGVGGALLQTAIDWLRSKGVKDIYLESGKNNHAAHRFFENRGFCHVSEIYKLA